MRTLICCGIWHQCIVAVSFDQNLIGFVIALQIADSEIQENRDFPWSGIRI